MPVRYADDLVVMCATREQAERALAVLTAMLADLGLEPKAAKTRIVHLEENGEGFDFLGFHHRWVRTRGSRRICFLGRCRWPSRKAMQHARDRIRQLTDRSRLWVDIEQIVQDINRFLRGWAGYFRYGNSARWFDKIHTTRSSDCRCSWPSATEAHRSYGWKAVVHLSPDMLGLLSLDGWVVVPRPNKPWREKPKRQR